MLIGGKLGVFWGKSKVEGVGVLRWLLLAGNVGIAKVVMC